VINIHDIRGQECQLTKVIFSAGVDLLIEQPNGDVIHLMMTWDQAKELGVTQC
jgi:hypothetical protein